METAVLLAAAGLLLLQPVQFLHLPLNLEPADLAALALLGGTACWLASRRLSLRLPWLLPMLCLLLVSALSVLISPRPVVGMIALCTEAYLFVLCAALAAVFAMADECALRRLLWCWLVAALANGALILVQFVEPAALAAMNGAVAGIGAFDPYRPSGLFENCNTAALFQLAAFVPLLRLQLGPAKTTAAAALLMLMTLGTGSMAAASGLAVGGVALLIAIAWLRRKPAKALRLAAGAAAALLGLVVALLAAAATSTTLAARLEYVLTGRGEGSAHSRFTIWRTAFDLILGEASPLGVGPDQFSAIAGIGAHNDLISVCVERGPLGLLALMAFFGAVLASALREPQLAPAAEDDGSAAHAAALFALLAFAQTHEILHQRPLWLLLALQVGLLQRRLNCASPAMPAASPRPATMRVLP